MRNKAWTKNNRNYCMPPKKKKMWPSMHPGTNKGNNIRLFLQCTNCLFLISRERIPSNLYIHAGIHHSPISRLIEAFVNIFVLYLQSFGLSLESIQLMVTMNSSYNSTVQRAALLKSMGAWTGGCVVSTLHSFVPGLYTWNSRASFFFSCLHGPDPSTGTFADVST